MRELNHGTDTEPTTPSRRRFLLGAGGSVAALVVAACSSSKSSTTTTSAPATAATTAASPASSASGTASPASSASGSASAVGALFITIKDFAFSPTPLSVAPGTTITVTNQDSTSHTLTATGGAFNTGTLAPGKSATITAPTQTGDFPYTCTIHPTMKGTLTVK